MLTVGLLVRVMPIRRGERESREQQKRKQECLGHSPQVARGKETLIWQSKWEATMVKTNKQTNWERGFRGLWLKQKK